MPTWKCPKEGNREYDRIVRTVYMRQYVQYVCVRAMSVTARQFLRSHVTATDPHNPGVQFSNILKTLSVAVQTARAKCVIIARDRLTLDTAPIVPFLNSLLPVPPPVSLDLPIAHVRYDAITPPPSRPAPPTAHLPPTPYFPPLPPTPTPPPMVM
jgi:hypothetical protein